MVVGSGAFAHDLVREFVGAAAGAGFHSVRYVDDRVLRPLSSEVGLARLEHFAQRVGASRIVLALPEGRNPLVERHLPRLRAGATTVEQGVDAYARLTGKLPIERTAAIGTTFSQGSRRSQASALVRRAVDVCGALLGLALLSPIGIAIAAAIKLDSAGAVFFVQERVGLLGQPFRMLKFRTMYPDRTCDSEWARDNSCRITRVGRRLRRFRLDEIPQLWNVLRGDMSLVGPRPHPLRNQTAFAQDIPFYSIRTRVKPGITGWAQVRYGYANDLAEETEKVRYDLYYVRHASLRLDLCILLETLKTVLFGRGE